MQTCPKCGGEMKLIPAGLSKKTGKPYQEFYSCKDWKCGGTLNAKNASTPREIPQMIQSPTPPPFAPPASKSESTELLTEIRDLLKSIDGKIPLRDPESGEIVPF